MFVRIDASEVHALARDLNSAGAYVEERAPQAVSKVGHDMQATAQAIVPVDTGYLKSSISSTWSASGLSWGRPRSTAATSSSAPPG
jgi:hypothetical protein